MQAQSEGQMAPSIVVLTSQTTRLSGALILTAAPERGSWDSRQMSGNHAKGRILGGEKKSGQRQPRENHDDSAARKTNGRSKAERWQRLTGSKKIICSTERETRPGGKYKNLSEETTPRGPRWGSRRSTDSAHPRRDLTSTQNK
jgi:hypothetical protein